MNLPIENYLAAFPTERTVGKVRLGPLTLGRFVLLDALGVDAQREIEEKDAALAAYVLSGRYESCTSDREEDFGLFAKFVKGDLKGLAKAANTICSDAFRTYLPPPNSRKNDPTQVSLKGVGWPLSYAEALCAEYGWTWHAALATPLATVFALTAAYRERNGIGQGGFDYMERLEIEREKNG